MRRAVRRRTLSPIWAFFIQACFITWFAWMPGLLLAPQSGYDLYTGVNFFGIFRDGFQNATHAAIVILFFVAVYGPFISALGVIYRLGGSQGVRDLWRRMTLWRVPGRWYLVVLLLPFINLLPALAVAYIVGVTPENPGLPLAAGLVPLFFIYQFLTSGMEEPAWRGFLLPFMQRRFTAEQASYMVGGLWALWHLPFVVSLYAGGPVEALPLAIVGFALNLVASSVIYTWLYNHTASVFLAMLYHAMSNMALTLITGWMGAHPLPQLVIGLTSWAIAWVLLRRYGAEQLVQDRSSDSGMVRQA